MCVRLLPTLHYISNITDIFGTIKFDFENKKKQKFGVNC